MSEKEFEYAILYQFARNVKKISFYNLCEEMKHVTVDLNKFLQTKLALHIDQLFDLVPGKFSNDQHHFIDELVKNVAWSDRLLVSSCLGVFFCLTVFDFDHVLVGYENCI